MVRVRQSVARKESIIATSIPEEDEESSQVLANIGDVDDIKMTSTSTPLATSSPGPSLKVLKKESFANLKTPQVSTPVGRVALQEINANSPAAPFATNKRIPRTILGTTKRELIPPPPPAPKERLIITRLVFENFKSYAGKQEIGPFHTSFSAVVGPNGSGKSNVIDGLLFVFGFRASKMRQDKVSSLIHKSAAHPNLDFCSVHVYFAVHNEESQSIEEGSDLVVSRKAFKNNSSTYTINDRPSSFTIVTTMLKEKGIDLTHKRFLILQGEVESIAQMKPKAGNEHEDGLLEYLEDIIGTNKYKSALEDASKDLEDLADSTKEKENRVKVIEKDKSALEGRKNAAVEFLETENSIALKNNILFQKYISECNTTLELSHDLKKEVKENLEIHAKKAKDSDTKSITKSYETEKREVDKLEKDSAKLVKKVEKLSMDDVKNDEKRKHVHSKLAKVSSKLDAEKRSAAESVRSMKLHDADMGKFQSEATGIEEKLQIASTELDTIRLSLQDKTRVFSDAIEVKQKQLQPWNMKIAEKQSQISIGESQLQLLEGEQQSVKAELANAEETLCAYKSELLGKKESLKTAINNQKPYEMKLQSSTTSVSSLKQQLSIKKDESSKADSNFAEAKSSLSKSDNEGTVLASLTRLSQSGRINGFYGRLGGLGAISTLYDVAISTACPSLNNIVVENVETGQSCIDYLRKNNIGRANFILLDRLPNRNLDTIQTPEGVPRLFDLIKLSEKKFAPAFYSVLQNTLVAKDLEQANRIAYGAVRWRVVTLDGQLIDRSGAMTGGGNKQLKGLMSSDLKAEMSKEAVEKLEKISNTLKEQVKELENELVQLEDKRQVAIKNHTTNASLIPTLKMEVTSLESSITDAEKSISDLKKRLGKNQEGEMQMMSIEATIKEAKSAISALEEQTSGIQSEIKELQDKIMEIGGVKLRRQKSLVDDLREKLSLLNDRISSSQISKSKAEKDYAKQERSVASLGSDLDSLKDELKGFERDADKQAELAELNDEIRQLNGLLKEKTKLMLETKNLLDTKLQEITASRAEEIDLNNRLKQHDRDIADNNKRLRHWSEKLDALELHSIGIDEKDDNEEFPHLTEDELEGIDKNQLKQDISTLEEKIADASVDMAALEEYRRRQQEFDARSKDLAESVRVRDESRKKCEDLRERRLREFMEGFAIISLRLKEMYQV